MKLSARKTIVALGTAAALSLTGVSAPAMAADAKTTTSETKTGDAAYSRLYKNVESSLKLVKNDLDALKASVKAQESKLEGDSDATAKWNDANRLANRAEGVYTSVEQDFNDLPKAGARNSVDYGSLQSLETQIRKINDLIDDSRSALRDAKPFKCDEEIADKNEEDQDLSSQLLNFGSIFSMMGSSGQEIVVKNGKKTCVNKVERMSEQLKQIVGILTVLFTVITTVTKIGDTVQKQLAPKN